MRICLGCFKSVEDVQTVHTYTVGEYKKREIVNIRYCDDCRKAFEAAFLPAVAPIPGTLPTAGTPSEVSK